MPEWVAHFDDSGQGHGPIFVMAGFVSTVEKWRVFVEQWDAALKLHPSIDYFKMREEANLQGQFERFDPAERDKRLRLFNQIIADNATFGIASITPTQDFYAVLKNKYSKSLDNPKYPAAVDNIIDTLVYMRKLVLAGKVTHVFDEMDKATFREILNIWSVFKRQNVGRQLARRMGQSPKMGNDKDVLPLQAADLLAWLIRRRYEEDHDNIPECDRLSAKLFPEPVLVPLLRRVWNKASLVSIMADTAKLWRLNLEQIVYEDAKTRSRILTQRFPD